MFPEYSPKVSPLFVVLASFFVACLLISNIIAGKLIQVFGIVLPAAVILFPVTYIFGDILTEVYGFKRSRIVIWSGLAANILMVLVFMITITLPYPEFWQGQQAYATVLGMTPRIVAASLIAYWAGEFSNSVLLSRIKLLTGGRLLWLRTIGSTIAGEGIDTFLFIGIAFGGLMPSSALWSMMLAQYLWKVGFETMVTPLTYLVVGWVKRKEGIDVFDHGVRYNPFSLEG